MMLGIKPRVFLCWGEILLLSEGPAQDRLLSEDLYMRNLTKHCL